MTNILVVIGSARKGRVADTVLTYIEEEAAKNDSITTTVADLSTLNLPFFDNEHAPSSPDYIVTNDNVKAWGALVAKSDAVVFITPEYNHALSAIQKNAIDSLFTEWNDKPVAIVAYGWYAGAHSVTAIRELAPVIKIDLKEPIAELAFTKDINPDGSLIDEISVREKISAALASIA